MGILRKYREEITQYGEDTLARAQLKLFALMLGANVAKGGIYLYQAYAEQAGVGSGRAWRLIITSIVILLLAQRFRKYLKGFMHYGVIATILHVYYRIFTSGVGTDVVAIQAILMVLISAFYGIGKKWGLIYGTIACAATLMVHVVDYRLQTLQALPRNLNDLYIAINWFVIIVSHFYFYNVLYGSLRSSQQLNENLADLAQTKSTFLSTMSHELRTPLNSVIGLAELMKADQNDEQQRKKLEMLLFSAHGLLSLVNDILDINKIDAGKMDLENTDFDLRVLLAGIASVMQTRAQQKNLDFTLSYVPGNQHYIGDPTRISQILYNLIGNAIKFTEQGTVTLKVTETKITEQRSSILFEVIDTGIGIEKAQQKLIFQPFQQAMASTTRKYGGTGLGLTIVTELLHLFGSSISVDSKPGLGTTMSFVLDMDHSSTQMITNARELNTSVNPLSKLRILLAEDNSLNVFFMEHLFKRWDITASIAENGQEALFLLENGTYDVILMDMYMPVMDGLEATSKIRKLKDLKKANIYIIALTASVSGEIRNKVNASGINDYLQKPFQLEDLKEKLQKAQLQLESNKNINAGK